MRNLVRFMRDTLVFLRELADRHGDVVEMKVLGKPFFLVSHPDDVEAVLVKHARVMLRDDFSAAIARALGKGLLTSDGDLWKRQRKLMAQAFVPKRIRSYGDAMVRVTEAALRPWRHGQTINLHHEMSRVTLEVVADVLFGSSVGPHDVLTAREGLEAVVEYLATSPEALLNLPGWVPTPRNVAMNRAVKRIDGLLYRIIARRRGAEPQDDLLGTLLSAQDDDGARMSDEQLRDEAITLFLAGHETTALLLAHTFYLLSKHPEVERRLEAEVASVLARARADRGRRARAPLRRARAQGGDAPLPARVDGRAARPREDVEVGGYVIPKGTQILLSQWVVHRDPRWFPNPEGFDPDRWTPERAADLPRFAYFPFGGGPRICIGNHFALMEATLILALVLQRFRARAPSRPAPRAHAVGHPAPGGRRAARPPRGAEGGGRRDARPRGRRRRGCGVTVVCGEESAVLVTGGNAGLGYHAARHVAVDLRRHVLLACRDPGRGCEAAARIAAETGNPNVVSIALDLARLRSVRDLAVALAARPGPPLGAVVCNAGTQIVSGLVLTEDGYETTFAVNHLGHFLLVKLLLPSLAANARVIFVSSGTHDPALRTGLPAPRLGSIRELARPDAADFRDPGLAGRRAYATSKLCNVLCAYELARRLAAAHRPITVNAFDPGLMPGSGLGRDYSAPARFAWRFVLPLLRPFVPNVNSVETSGERLAALVQDPRFAGVSGKYFVGAREERSSAESYDEAKAAALWAVSEELADLRTGNVVDTGRPC